ncbi:MAG TPA: type VI secretion system membrane subunit TssM [Xanthomonadales bacterium]|nr:type VI secretion system membrane subunit TssM [Xanthomonadales bacterium]
MEGLIGRLISMGMFRYLGVGAAALFIWYMGPYIEFLRPAKNRLICILIVAALFGLYTLTRWILAKRKEKNMSKDLAENADEEVDRSRERSDEEIATLKDKFDEALSVLKKSGKGKFRHGGLYSLPWYMIIGPPGAGKTTLLVHSGLRFPLADKMGLKKLAGVGGTRFCDWWFTDEAVIVDTAGRYVMQDSDEKVDNAAWLGFLRMLRKNRKRRPINGIVVAISIDELSRSSEVDRERAAVAVRARVQELYEQLGVRFPIYVMFTKCDLLAGFMEFFDDLDRHEREQVWGTTFNINVDLHEELEGELDLLQDHLEARLVQRLQQERDPQRRNLIYNFQGSFNAVKPLVTGFMERAFKPSRYETAPFLRGVYFTSGTQEGTPFNRLISQLARNFSLTSATAYSGSGQGKSFFVRDLLSKVIFGESGLAGTNLKAQRIYGLMRAGGFIAVGIIPLLLVALWWWSSINNHGMIDSLDDDARQITETIETVSPQNTSLVSVLPVLNEGRELTTGYAASKESVPLKMQFGLYQGRRLAKNLTIPAYQRLLENAFLSRILVSLEQQLRDNLSNPEYAYQALKTYLMLGDDERLNTGYVRRYISTDWQARFGDSLSSEQYADLESHLDALLDLRPFALPFPLDDNLIERVRGALEQTSPAQRAYAMIKSEILTEGEEFTAAREGGPDARQALIRLSGEPLTRGVPAMFSPEGYYQMFVPTQARVIGEQEDEFWIFATEAAQGSSIDSAELTNQVSTLYFDDFIETWWEFLADIRIRRFSTFAEAAEILRIITSDDSPPVLVLQGAAQKTQLMPDAIAGDDDNESFIGAVTELIGANGEEIPFVSPAAVDREFRPLHDLMERRDGRPSALDGIMEDIEELYTYVHALARSGTGDVSAGMQSDFSNAVNRVRMSGGYAPTPIDGWIEELASQNEGLVAGRTMAALQARWQAEVVPFCSNALSNRYPFSPGSDSEVSLQDFGQFFGPGGVLDRFFQNNLAEYVDTNSRPWRVRPGVADVIRISDAALRQLEIARRIQRAFFAHGGDLPATQFDLQPVGMDPKSTHFTLNLDGQTLNYSHGPLVSNSMRWPSESTFSQVQIQFSPDTSEGGSRTDNGAWAWFRLLDRSDIEAGERPEQFRLTFSLADRWITYDLRARSAFSPFNLSQLRSFRCVSSL